MVNYPIRVLLVDDHQIVRIGIKTALGSFKQIEFVGEAANCQEALEEIARLKPDVVLLDIRLPDGTGFDVCRQVRKHGPDTHILFLTSFADDGVVGEVLDCGADGFILKDNDPAGVVAAIENVASGRSVLDPAVTKRALEMLKAQSTGAGADHRMSLLSRQELRVIALVTQGKTNKEIGIELSLSDKTVKNYLSNAMEKLQVGRRSQVAAFYVQYGQS
jgi:two-component system response regulator DevR